MWPGGSIVKKARMTIHPFVRANRPLAVSRRVFVAALALLSLLPMAGVPPTFAASGTDGSGILATPGLRDYYRMDAVGGSVLQDSKGSRNGTISASGVSYGVPGALAGDSDTALGFDGRSGYTTVPNGDAGVTGGAMTIEGWVKPSGPHAASQGYFGWRNYVSADFYVTQRANSNNLEARLTNSAHASFTIDAVAATPQTWHYIALTYDGSSTLALFVDGAQRASIPANGHVTDGAQNLEMGESADGNYLNGAVDDVAVYNVALSADQVSGHYNLGTTGVGSPPTPGPTPIPTPPAAGNVQVNYGNPVLPVSPLAFSIDESAYGNGSYLTNDASERQRFQTLGSKMMRIELVYTTPGDPSSPIVCGALGCDHSISGDAWINAIKATGAMPELLVPLNPTDAANLVRHFNVVTYNTISRFIVGNEPDLNGVSATSYSQSFNSVYDAMKAVDPNITIGGPATAWYDAPFLQTFLQASGSRADFVDFHDYGEGYASKPQPASTLMASTGSYETNVQAARTLIQTLVPNRAGQIAVEVGEWSLSYNGADPLCYQNFDTVWAASVIGHIIAADGIERQYATKGGSGGAVFDTANATYGASVDQPMPIYHAHGMFTGESLFPGFGTSLVAAITTLPNVEVYASDGPKDIVAINKDSSAQQAATFSLNGISSGTVQIWRKDQSMNAFAAPANLGSVPIINGAFTYQLPPYSVTTFVVTPAS